MELSRSVLYMFLWKNKDKGEKYVVNKLMKEYFF